MHAVYRPEASRALSPRGLQPLHQMGQFGQIAQSNIPPLSNPPMQANQLNPPPGQPGQARLFGFPPSIVPQPYRAMAPPVYQQPIPGHNIFSTEIIR